MLSAASCPFPLNSVAASRWREVQALYRRLCVLRSAEKNSEAAELESGLLPPALEALRGSSTVTQQQLDALFAAEEERVASARLLAEILLPMLTAATLPRNLAQATEASATSRKDNPATTVPDVSPLPSLPVEASSANTTPGLPGIADFIDEMLSQERAPRGSRRSA